VQLNKLSSIIRELGYKKVALAPFALSFILTLLLINKFRTVRIHEVINSRLGHFVTNTELSRLSSLKKNRDSNKKSLDLYCFLHRTSTNHFLEILWRRTLICLTGDWGSIFYLLATRTVPKLVRESDFDNQNGQLYKYPIALEFSPAELSEGKKFLRNLGIQEKDKFVCINVRDSSFLQKSQPLGWSKSKDWSYHDYRDTRIANYVVASEKLAELGYTVFRMGAIVSEPLLSEHPRVFDYATNGMRTEFLDVFLGAHCEFCISTGSGWDEIPGYFRRPRMYVNIIPSLTYQILDRELILYPKILLNSKNNDQLTLKEIIETEVHQIGRTVEYADRGVVIKDMSSEELVEAVTEMATRVEGRFVPTEQQKLMREKLRHELTTNTKVQPSPGYYPVRAEFASCFLSNYPNFID